MKKLFLTLGAFITGTLLFAQTTSVSTSTSTKSNLSISVSKNNKNYGYQASFDKEKTQKVKDTIIKSLGKPNEETDRTAYWTGSGYDVELRRGKVEMEVNKEKVTKSFMLKMEDLGDQISESLGQKDSPKPPKPPKNDE